MGMENPWKKPPKYETPEKTIKAMKTDSGSRLRPLWVCMTWLFCLNTPNSRAGKEKKAKYSYENYYKTQLIILKWVV